MELFKEFVVVKVTDIFNETVGKGTNAAKLLVNVTFDPARHVRCWGIVVSVPRILPRVPIASDTFGLPGYAGNMPPFKWKTADDIEMEVNTGDKVYFHHNCLLPDMNEEAYNSYYMYSRLEDRDGNGVNRDELTHEQIQKGLDEGKYFMQAYFRVKYELIYAAVRYIPINKLMPAFCWADEKELVEFTNALPPETDEDQEKPLLKMYMNKKESIYMKKIVMIGSYVFVEPDMESWEDISIPTPETVNGIPLMEKGRPVMKPKDQWVVVKSTPGKKYLAGWVRHIGSPLKGDRCDIREGAYVYFRPLLDTVIEFEGFHFYKMRQRYISGYNPHKSDGARKTDSANA
jgi:hypothetical protein